MQFEGIKVIGFDADDTLWVNEPYFRDAEEHFCDLFESYMPRHDIHRELFKIEIKNLPLYGYGIKAFMLSMIETAMSITNGRVDGKLIQRIMDIGNSQLNLPVEVLPGVESVLQQLQPRYKLVVVTKGDLLDQERKLQKSGLESYFHHVEIVSEKTPKEYNKLFTHLDINATQFLMVGNSVKSDILPILELGAYGIHIPFHTTWAHEQVDVSIDNPKFRTIEQITDIIRLL
jgi:putative hydrolase of the HAD superfamily